MSYKILITDDEPLILQAIEKKLEADILEKNRIYLANDGLEALEKAKKIHPDIILTDIRMPEIDGIAFISQLHQLGQRPECIIISGYSEFEYAQCAIKLGVKDYILKPIDGVQLNKAINKAIKNCDQRSSESISKSVYYTHDEMLKMIERDKKYTQALFSQCIQIFKEKLPHTIGENLYTIGIVRIKDIDFRRNGFKDSEEELFEYAVRNMLKEICYQVLWFKNTSIKNEYIFITDKNIEYMVIKLHEVINKLQDFLAIICIGGIGLSVSLDKLELSYNHAKEAICEQFLRGHEKVYKYKKVSGKSIDEEIKRIYNCKAFETYLEQCNVKQVITYVEELFKQIIQDEIIKYYHFNYIIMDMYMKLKSLAIEKSGDSYQDWFDVNCFTKNFLEYRNIEEVKKELLIIIEGVFKYRGEMRTGIQIAESVLVRIDNQYDEEISLSIVAAQYHINPEYFCRVFKEHTGYNFSDYITRVRIKKAIELLNTTPFKIGKIANMIGFKDAKYFSKVFKKELGITPKKYLAGREKYVE